jgi:hypothetical protein
LEFFLSSLPSGKPLPPPPPGFYWERLPDKSWELKRYQHDVHASNAVVFEAPSVIEHVVLHTDTLQGLCLRYRVSAVTLRQYNNFSGNAFRSKKYLRIPIEPGLPVSLQLGSEDALIQRFKNETSESESEARYYLVGNNWDVAKALREWSGDESWVSEQLPLAIPMAPPSGVVVAPAAVVNATILGSIIPAAIEMLPRRGYQDPEIDMLSEPLLPNRE